MDSVDDSFDYNAPFEDELKIDVCVTEIWHVFFSVYCPKMYYVQFVGKALIGIKLC